MVKQKEIVMPTKMLPLVVLFFVLGCGDKVPTEPERIEGAEPGDCTDLADNDSDGLFDCDDDGCATSPECDEAHTDADADAGTGANDTADPSDSDSGSGSDTGTMTDDTGTVTDDTGDTDEFTEDTATTPDGDADDDTGSTTDTGSAADGEDPDAADCPIDMVSPVTPSGDGATDFFYRDPIVFSVDAYDPDASISVTHDGDAIAGEVTWTDSLDTIQFIPTSPLTPASPYDATLTTCAGETVVHFLTSALGTPIESIEALVGNTYVLDMASSRSVHPEGLGSTLTAFFEAPLLLGLNGISESTFDFIVAPTIDVSDTTQDTCSPTVSMTTASLEAPFFTLGPWTLNLNVASIPATLDEAHFSGTFAADGSFIGNGTLTGQLDTRPLVPLLISEGSSDSICSLAEALGVSCIPCPSDSEPFCFDVKIDQIESAMSDTPIIPIDECDPELCLACD